MPRKVENIIGKRFGRLVVLENLGIHTRGGILHKCACDCGKIANVPIFYLKNGHTKSCGCLRKERVTTHDLSGTRLYKIHSGMLKRCYNPKAGFYENYGGRGICVCDEWRNDFLSFYNWAIENGYRDDLSIDRINNDGNYEPSNCRWATRKEQNENTRRNKFFTFNGETKTITEWSRISEIPLTTLFRRIKQNRPIDEIFYKGDLKCLKRK